MNTMGMAVNGERRILDVEDYGGSRGKGFRVRLLWLLGNQLHQCISDNDVCHDMLPFIIDHTSKKEQIAAIK